MSKKQIDSFLLDDLIGGGSYGEVWRGRIIGCVPSTVAFRCVRRKVQEKLGRLQNEARVLRRVTHTNILCFHGLRKSTSYFYLALEHCGGGDLAQLLLARGPLPEADSWRFCVQITAGLFALHCQSLFHGNLQPRSVLLSDASADPELKLANFNSKSEPNAYTAPEVLRGDPCNGQADMWSAGAILYEMLFGRPPFHGTSRSQLLASHLSSEVSFSTTRAVTGEGRAFCRSLLGRHSPERLSSLDCSRHAYVKQGPPKLFISLDRRLVSPRVCEFQLAPLWFVGSARLACLKIAKHCVETFGARDLGGQVDAELIGEAVEGKLNRRSASTLRTGGGLHKPLLDRSVITGAVTYFVVGQLQYSHLFRLRTARLFPIILSL